MKVLVVSACFVFLTGCATLGRQAPLPLLSNAPGVHIVRNTPPVAQEAYQCGPAALESVFHRWGKTHGADIIASDLMGSGERGVLNFMLAKYAHDRGYWTQTFQSETSEDIKSWIEKDIPPIVMLRIGPVLLQDYHFVVIKGFNESEGVYYANIGKGQTYVLDDRDFQGRWKDAHFWTLIVCPPDRVDWDLDPGEANRLALLLEKEEKWDRAEYWYQKVLHQDPSHTIIRYNLANLYLKTERIDEAESIFKALAEERPDWAPTHNNLAWIHLRRGFPDEAIRVIESAFENGAERRFEMLDTLAQAYCTSGLFSEAEDLFDEAIRQIPSSEITSRHTVEDHRASCREILQTG